MSVLGTSGVFVSGVLVTGTLVTGTFDPGRGPLGIPMLVGAPGVPGATVNPGKEGVPRGTFTVCPGSHCWFTHCPDINWLLTQSPGTN